MNIFGTSTVSLHAYALTISVSLLCSVYWIGLRLADAVVALFAVLLVVVNEAFLAQSGLLLPEVMLALWSLWSCYFFIRRNAYGYIITASCALLTKESAVVLIVALLSWLIIDNCDRKQEGRFRSLRWSMITMIPVGVASLFFVYQRIKFGWFFFPEHMELQSWEIKDIIYKVKLAYSDLFEHQGSNWVAYGFGFIGTIAWFGKKIRWSLLVIVLYITAIKVLFGRWTLSPTLTLIVPMACLTLILIFLFLPYRAAHEQRGQLVGIGFIFTFGFIGFSALNFFTDRYLVCVIPFVALGTAIFLNDALGRWEPRVFPATLILLVGIMGIHIGSDPRISDTRLSYLDAISVNRSLIRFCEEERSYDAEMLVRFTQQHYMTEPDAGYLSSDRIFTQLTNEPGNTTEYAILTNEVIDDRRNELLRSGFGLIKTFEQGHARAELFSR